MTPSQIREIRRRLGLRQCDLAKRLRVSSLTVSRWERGQTMPLPVLREALRLMAERLNKVEEHATD